MTTTKCLALTAVLVASVSSAHAEMKAFARAGAWSAYAGTATDSSKPMCRMTSSSDIRGVHVKWMIGLGLFIHVTKDNWNVPTGVEMPLTIRFDQEAPFKGAAKRHVSHPRLIELKIKEGADARRFMDQFETSDMLHVLFPGGSERDWVLRMDGSDTIAQKFTQCVVALNKKYGGRRPTQPFDSHSFDSQPFESQPFGWQDQSGSAAKPQGSARGGADATGDATQRHQDNKRAPLSKSDESI